MDAARDAVPDDIAALKAALAAERAKGLEIAAELAVARAKASEDEALIAQQKLQIAIGSRSPGSAVISPAPAIRHLAIPSCGAGCQRLTDIALDVMVGGEFVGN